MLLSCVFRFFYALFCFFFNDTATTEIYTLSLHDALPICVPFCPGADAPRGEVAIRRNPSDATARRHHQPLLFHGRLLLSSGGSAAGSRHAFRQLPQEFHAKKDPARGEGRFSLPNRPLRTAPRGLLATAPRDAAAASDSSAAQVLVPQSDRLLWRGVADPGRLEG